MGRPRMEGGQGGRRGIGGLKTVLVLTSPGSNQKVPHDARSRTNSDFQRDGVPTTVPLLFLSALRARASIAARAATHAAAAQCTRRPILRTRVHTIVHTHTKRNTPAAAA